MSLDSLFLDKAFSALGVGVSLLFLAFHSKFETRTIRFVLVSVLCGSFLSCHISPYFGVIESSQSFGLLGAIVVALGGIVGGVLGILLPKVTMGVILGYLLSILTVALVALISAKSSDLVYLAPSASAGGIVLGIFLSLRYERMPFNAALGLVIGLVIALSVDRLFSDHALQEVLRQLVLFNSVDVSSVVASHHHQMVGLVIVWVVVCLVHVALCSGNDRNRGAAPNRQSEQHQQQQHRDPGFAKQKTFTYYNTAVHNLFDVDSLPVLLKPFSSVVFSTGHALVGLYGFQLDSSKNQAEHLLMLLTNEVSPNDKTGLLGPAARLHNKMFGNYRQWCNHMLVLSQLELLDGLSLIGVDATDQDVSILGVSSGSDVNRQRVNKLIADMLLFLLIWGEAGNLKHLPECLCFLFHKTVDSRSRFSSKQVYPGFFLDMVVTPLYEVLSVALNAKGDHSMRKTYDDFNEFFWSQHCLDYGIVDRPEQAEDAEMGKRKPPPKPNGEERGTRRLSQALDHYSKTYVEKRSWLHPLLSMHRIFEWHLVTFTLLATWAFAMDLIWDYAYTYKIGSFIFWEISFLGIVWTCLEVWTLFPNAYIPEASKCGYVIRLLAGYLVLVYQSIYYNWSFPPESIRTPVNSTSSVQFALSMRSQGDENFWWWQYVWLSLIALFFYFLESLLCWFPGITTSMLTWNNGVVQAAFNILYPLTQLYIGKRTSVPQKQVLGYIMFWIPLIAFKLWFGYAYLIYPVTVPSLELFDDYMNYGSPFSKTAVLLFLWWSPHYLVYLIDLSIWYAVWSSITGGLVALVDRQGEVRDLSSMRAHFERCPQAFCQKIQSVSSMQLPRGIAPSSANLIGLLQSSTAISRQTSADAPSEASQLRTGLVGAVTQWQSIFARVWNEIIESLRLIDLLKNEQRDNFLFSTFEFLSKPVYLPLFQTAGCIDAAVSAYQMAAAEFRAEPVPQNKIKILEKFGATLGTNSIKEAVFETWELTGWLLKLLLGNQHDAEINQIVAIFDAWSNSSTGEILNDVSTGKLPEIVASMSNIVDAILGVHDKRQRDPVVHASILLEQELFDRRQEEEYKKSLQQGSNDGGGMKRSNSSGFLLALDPSAVDQPTKKEESSSLTTPDSQKKSSSGFAKVTRHKLSYQLTDTCRDKVRDELRLILGNVKGLVQSKSQQTDAKKIVGAVGQILSNEKGFLLSDVYASSQIDSAAQDGRVKKVLRKLRGLLKLRRTECDSIPREAIRRLTFFVNSLFMDMPTVGQTRFAKEFTVLTPYYGEDVILSKTDLEEKNSDGITTMLYLQSLHQEDWSAFLQRRGIDETKIWASDHIMHTRMWASMRAQTLFRTVEGMMHSEAAIRLICELEGISEDDTNNLVKMKFNYVVACQIYGQLKKKQDPKAADIDFLLQRYPNLRVAYIDSVRDSVSRDVSFFSVLVKFDPMSGQQQEVYRVKLAGNPVVGEGKPENQNHAIIFTRGRYLQAIDMNQDGYFEEALKMRNLLEEFDDGYSILGFREHIFTGSVSSVANYMAMQELSFVTLGQRVLAKPLRIRQHYGHPDFFDKLFVMTEGGMSKASKGINLSEDVFAGFNATLRGKSVGFREYAQVGKGRDVGLQQTYKFEAKLSQGNAEQSLSRDLARICDRLDFFRLLSFYYGGIGHYMANTMVMFTLVIVVYIMVGLAIFGEEGVNGRKITPEGAFELLLAGMGILQTLPLAVTLTVENGLRSAFVEIAYMILSGGPLYFIFHIQTKCYYFQTTLMAGGAKYRPTGRGFVIRHSPFDENFRFFACSHIYLGFELMAALILFGLATASSQYFGLTWSLWLAVVSFLLGPFWFNPLSFQFDRLREDYFSWQKWMTETVGSVEQSWYSWWYEENCIYKDLSLSWKILLFFQKCGIWSLLAAGLLGSRLLRDKDEQTALAYFIITILVYSTISWLLSKFEQSLSYPIRRLTSITVSVAVLFALVWQLVIHSRLIRYVIGLYYLVSAISFVFVLAGRLKIVSPLYKIHDNVVGVTLFAILSVLTVLQAGRLQTSLLYYDALSNGVVLNDMMKQMQSQKSRSQGQSDEVSSLQRELNDQKAALARQVAYFQQLLSSRGRNGHHSMGEYDADGEMELTERHGLLQSSERDHRSYGSTNGKTERVVLDQQISEAAASTGTVVLSQPQGLTPLIVPGDAVSPAPIRPYQMTTTVAQPSLATGLYGSGLGRDSHARSKLPPSQISSVAKGNVASEGAARPRSGENSPSVAGIASRGPFDVHQPTPTTNMSAVQLSPTASVTPAVATTTVSSADFRFVSPTDLPPRN